MVNRISFDVNGRTLSALESGNASNPLALLLHGIPASAELWRDILSKVSKHGWYCLAPDCPGYGQTRLLERDDYSVRASALFFIDWLRQQAFSNVWLIAHDIGGGIAQNMLLEASDLFQKLTISNSAVESNWPVPAIRLMKATAKAGLFPFAATIGIPTSYLSKMELLRAVYHKKAITQDTINRIFMDGKFRDKVGRAEFARMLLHLSNKDTRGLLEKLSDLALPVHIVWGMNDPYQSWERTGVLLEKAFSNKAITFLDEAGHFLQLDAPNRYVEAILQY